jgi:hypothetical protein
MYEKSLTQLGTKQKAVNKFPLEVLMIPLKDFGSLKNSVADPDDF